MSRIQSIPLGLLAAFVVSAAMSATAGASATHIFLIENTPLTTEEVIQGESQSIKIEMSALKIPIYVECGDGKSTGIYKTKGESEDFTELKGCYLVENSKGKKSFLTGCSLAEPIEVKGNGLLTLHGVNELKEFSGEIVVQTCALKGAFSLEGANLCAIPEAEFNKVAHRFTCTPAGGKLKSGGVSAQLFEKSKIELCTKVGWASN